MIVDLLKYISIPLRGYVKYADNVYSAAVRQSDGQMQYGPQNEEGKSISINDSDGTVIYTRVTGDKVIKNQKRITSSAQEFDITVPCRLVFYSFEIQKKFSVDKVENHLMRVLKDLDFSHYIGTSKDIKLNVLKSSNDYQKIFNQETGKTFQANDYPVIISIDFEVSYKNTSCDDCDYSKEENNCLEYPIDSDLFKGYETTFCDKVANCEVITSITKKIDALQEQIDNLPQGFGCEDLPACQTIIDIEEEITDLSNKKLGLIQIVDKSGEFFTDLETATTYIEQFITPSLITDKSFKEGIFFFTVPDLTIVNGYFLIDNTTPAITSASLIDRYGLLDLTNAQEFGYMNNGNHILGNGYFQNGTFYMFGGIIEVDYLDIVASAGNFAEASTGKFIIKGNIGPTEGANYGATFFPSSTATILVKASKYTSNAGGIHGDLQTAIANGCNVQFDGIDLPSKYEQKNSNIQNHISNTSNPHGVTKSQIGLSNVDNTSDINKPVSTPQSNYISANEYVSASAWMNATNLADSTTYFIGQSFITAGVWANDFRRCRFNLPGTSKIISIRAVCLSNTATSGQDCVLKLINHTTATEITLGNVRFDNVTQVYLFTGLTFSGTNGNEYSFKLEVPALTTNGLGSQCYFDILIKKD